MSRKHKKVRTPGATTQAHPTVRIKDRSGFREVPIITAESTKVPMSTGARPESDRNVQALLAVARNGFAALRDMILRNEITDPSLNELLALPFEEALRLCITGRWKSAREVVAHLGPALRSIVTRVDANLSRFQDLHHSYTSAAKDIVRQQIEESEKRLLLSILHEYRNLLEELELQIQHLEETQREILKKQGDLPAIHQELEAAQNRLLQIHRKIANFPVEIEQLLDLPLTSLQSRRTLWQTRLKAGQETYQEIRCLEAETNEAKRRRRLLVSEIEHLIHVMDAEIQIEIDRLRIEIQHFTFVFDAANVPISDMIAMNPHELLERAKSIRTPNLYATPTPPCARDLTEEFERFQESLEHLEEALESSTEEAAPTPVPPSPATIIRFPGRPNLAPTTPSVFKKIGIPFAIPASRVSEEDEEDPKDRKEITEKPKPPRFIVIPDHLMRDIDEFYRRLVLTVLDITVLNRNQRNKKFRTLWWEVINPVFRPSLNLARASRAFHELQQVQPPLIEIREHGSFTYPIPTEAGSDRARRLHLLPAEDIRLLAEFNEAVSDYRRKTYGERKTSSKPHGK